MGVPLDEGAGAAKALRDAIERFNEVTNRQTETVIQLTTWLLVLAVIMTIAVVVQIFVMCYQLGWRWR